MATAPQRRTQSTPAAAVFVELPRPQSSPAGQIVVRLVGRDGEQLEIAGDIDVLVLVRELWNRAR